MSNLNMHCKMLCKASRKKIGGKKTLSSASFRHSAKPGCPTYGTWQRILLFFFKIFFKKNVLPSGSDLALGKEFFYKDLALTKFSAECPHSEALKARQQQNAASQSTHSPALHAQPAAQVRPCASGRAIAPAGQAARRWPCHRPNRPSPHPGSCVTAPASHAHALTRPVPRQPRPCLKPHHGAPAPAMLAPMPPLPSQPHLAQPALWPVSCPASPSPRSPTPVAVAPRPPH